MTDLIACLSSGKGTWSEVRNLVEKGDWNNTYLITDEFGVKRFSSGKRVNFILIDSGRPMDKIIEDIRCQLNDKIVDTEVALNMISGTGKEHMAVICAILKLGLGVRLVSMVGEEIVEA